MSYSQAQICAAIRNLEAQVFKQRNHGIISLPMENSLRIDILSQLVSESGSAEVDKIEQVISDESISQLLTQIGLIKDSDGNYIPGTKTITEALQFLYNNLSGGTFINKDIELYKDMVI